MDVDNRLKQLLVHATRPISLLYRFRCEGPSNLKDDAGHTTRGKHEVCEITQRNAVASLVISRPQLVFLHRAGKPCSRSGRSTRTR